MVNRVAIILSLLIGIASCQKSPEQLEPRIDFSFFGDEVLHNESASSISVTLFDVRGEHIINVLAGATDTLKIAAEDYYPSILSCDSLKVSDGKTTSLYKKGIDDWFNSATLEEIDYFWRNNDGQKVLYSKKWPRYHYSFK